MFCLRWTQKHKISKGGVTPQHNSNRLDGEKICCIPARALYTFAVSKLLVFGATFAVSRFFYLKDETPIIGGSTGVDGGGLEPVSCHVSPSSAGAS